MFFSALWAAEVDVVFCIGEADGMSAEFGLAKAGYAEYSKQFPNDVAYFVGKSKASDWSFVHPAQLDPWAGSKTHTQKIHFTLAEKPTQPLHLIIGYIANMPSKESMIEISVNDQALPPQKNIPSNANTNIVFNPTRLSGNPKSQLFAVPTESLKQGENIIAITLNGGSWLLYDYVALRAKGEPLAVVVKPKPDLLAEFKKDELKNVKKIVFTTRTQTNEHWYANIGYYASNQHVGDQLPAPNEGGKLCIYDIDTKQVEVLIDDRLGIVRDPCVHYDGDKILYSYKPSGTNYFHLYEMDLRNDNKIRQITNDEFDDIEPTYTPDDKIIFVSTRAKRWVNCWLTQVAILYGCDLDGGNIHALSANIEQDNTPWFLPNGQVLYMRWEYVDRSQVHYHHLWVMNPDGTKQMVYYGNMHPGEVYIDAKPIPNSDKVVASFSHGHGRTEHAGAVGIIDPRNGPDDKKMARQITAASDYRDPWAFSENCFMAAQNDKIELINASGETRTLFQIPEDWKSHASAGKVIRDRSEVRASLSPLFVHEPRPLIKREREQVIGKQTNDSQPTGELTLLDVYQGRNMHGIKRGEIKKLLILETLPMPIHYTGGMEPVTYGGSFTLERVVGTVPVDPDGSARFKLPAKRAFFFVALDENNLAVKRMQSFLTVMPGESTSCVGCHEERTASPIIAGRTPTAMTRPASPITKITETVNRLSKNSVTEIVADGLPIGNAIPDVIDYPRDIQPVWDKHCVECHNPDKREGRFNLSGDRGAMYSISYSNIMSGTHLATENERYGKETLVADGRNRPQGNYPPRTLGSSASAIYTKYCQKAHYNVNLSEREKMLVLLWIETGAAYIGTYAGLGSGMLGGYAVNTQDRADLGWEETKSMQAALQKNCASCHTGQKQLPISVSDEVRHTWWVYPRDQKDSRREYSRHLFFDLTKPEKSVMLMAPLSKDEGGYGVCGEFALKKDDETYKTILAGIERAKLQLNTIKRFDMPNFQPRPEYIREMKRFGILPKDFDPNTPVDYYSLDQKYWQSLWFKIK
jgi:mono/diheme cytochrome c family protein/cytochrome c553